MDSTLYSSTTDIPHHRPVSHYGGRIPISTPRALTLTLPYPAFHPPSHTYTSTRSLSVMRGCLGSLEGEFLPFIE